MTAITIQTFSGRTGPDGQPELIEERTVALSKEQEAAIKAQALAASDGAMARVTEELFDALAAKGVVAPADLSAFARDRLAERKALRGGT